MNIQVKVVENALCEKLLVILHKGEGKTLKRMSQCLEGSNHW